MLMPGLRGRRLECQIGECQFPEDFWRDAISASEDSGERPDIMFRADWRCRFD